MDEHRTEPVAGNAITSSRASKCVPGPLVRICVCPSRVVWLLQCYLSSELVEVESVGEHGDLH